MSSVLYGVAEQAHQVTNRDVVGRGEQSSSSVSRTPTTARRRWRKGQAFTPLTVTKA